MRKRLIVRDKFLPYWQTKIDPAQQPGQLIEPLAQLRQEMPAVFAGVKLDHFTGFGYRWRTLQNEKSRGEVPTGVVIESE